jgi:pyrroloquinoline quinone biosynthesis protein D
MTPAPRLKLAPHARLRFDRFSGRWMLLAPERGLLLNGTAAAMVRKLDGEHTEAEVVAALERACPPPERPLVASDVRRFLAALLERRLVETVP